MKLYIESIFDKETNTLDAATKKAIEAANSLEAKYNNTAAGKIYYFATAIDKMIMVVGDVAKQAMAIDKNVLAVKDIPNLQLGDIPTKFAKYQELVIPTVSIDNQKVVFTRIKDMNGEEELGVEFKIIEVPNDNPVVTIDGKMVEIIDGQPKFLRIQGPDYVYTEVKFDLMDMFKAENVEDVSYLIKVNGKDMVIKIHNELGNMSISIDNKTNIFADVESKILNSSDDLNINGVEVDTFVDLQVKLYGYFSPETDISILGREGENKGHLGYVQKSIEVIKVRPFEVPAPYTGVANLISGVAKEHDITSKKIKLGSSLAAGAVMAINNPTNQTKIISIKDSGGFKFGLSVLYPGGEIAIYFNGGTYTKIPLKVNDYTKTHYYELKYDSVNQLAIVRVDNETATIPFKANVKEGDSVNVVFGSNKSKFVTDCWYWTGNINDITKNLEDQGKITIQVELSDIEKADLARIREEMKFARDVYGTLYGKWGMEPFDVVIQTKQVYMDVLKSLLDRYNVQDPLMYTENEVGKFNNKALQELYNNLVAQGEKSIADALNVGCTIEDLEIEDVKESLNKTNNDDLIKTYTKMESGCKDHFKLFYSSLVENGGSYKPQYMPEEDFVSIVGESKDKSSKSEDNKEQQDNSQSQNVELTDVEIESLKHMREEEKIARDVYTTLYEKWQASPFDKIINAEQEHMDAIKKLLDQFGIEDPIKDIEDKIGEFKTDAFKKLYADLVAQGEKSIVDALTVGCTIEDLDIYDLETESEKISNEDILKVFSNLMKGSRNHMRAFYPALKDNGGDYTPQYISQEEFDEIVNSDIENEGEENKAQNENSNKEQSENTQTQEQSDNQSQEKSSKEDSSK